MPDPRVRVSLSCTVPTGNYSSVRLELMEERDVSSLSNEGQTRAAILERLTHEIGEWKKKQSSTALPTAVPTALPTTVHTPLPTTPKPPGPITTQPPIPQPGSVSAVSDLDLIAELDRLPWIDNKKGNGWHVLVEELRNPYKAVLLTKFTNTQFKSVPLGAANYTRFGDSGEWLGKFSAVKK